MTDDRRDETDRDRIGEQTMDEQPGLSGGEFPGAEDETESMSDELAPDGEATTFGGHLGEPGPPAPLGRSTRATREISAAPSPPRRASKTCWPTPAPALARENKYRRH